MEDFFSEIAQSFEKTFITDDRWLQILNGLWVTIQITIVAAIIGLVLGFLIAIVRSTYDMQLMGRKCKSAGDWLLKILNFICNLYITVIRGTPVVIQLMIMYAYVAEIMRSGIMSIDKGQFEASRSIGFDYKRTMLYIIVPQAFKNILPALGNEFIVLVKETSVAGYVALQDLTYVGNLIRSRTYEAFFPLITVAVIYLIIVLILSFLLKKLERRLRNSDH